MAFIRLRRVTLMGSLNNELRSLQTAGKFLTTYENVLYGIGPLGLQHKKHEGLFR
jgi:hypothetical protein